ncbi:hypothetical protein [Rhizobium sp. Root564]|uniref:hypothetical protein n=1 Tax=Agrobacterium cavarae TaxID=2528239 RepID=UPI0007127123|nr:hypothetical protein ASD74_15980 [Rhizobium sp. Root564]
MVFIRGDLASGWMDAGANVTRDFPAAGPLQSFPLEIEILLAGQNSHGAYQHDRSPSSCKLRRQEFIGYSFCTGIYKIWQLFRDFQDWPCGVASNRDHLDQM